ncbi:MAG TPA: hypothetical protein VN879_06755 [Candidatus Acidoferrales bacterium]|nr:hypothetical protein [Candidatus Acidoferrales bacterium]
MANFPRPIRSSTALYETLFGKTPAWIKAIIFESPSTAPRFPTHPSEQPMVDGIAGVDGF